MQRDPQIMLNMSRRQTKYSALVCNKKGMTGWIIGMTVQKMAHQWQKENVTHSK